MASGPDLDNYQTVVQIRILNCYSYSNTDYRYGLQLKHGYQTNIPMMMWNSCPDMDIRLIPMVILNSCPDMDYRLLFR